jgi:hypothetical protein
MRFVLLFITSCFITIYNVNAQVYTGVVVDDKQIAIPFVNINFSDIDGNIYGWTTNDKGTFVIANTALHMVDSITISCIGYYTDKIAILDLHQDKENIFILKTKTYSINELTISANKNKIIKEIGNHKNRSDAGSYYPLRNEIAVFIKNTDGKSGFIKCINIKLVNKDKTTLPVRVHVYSVNNSNNGPQKELLHESIFTKSKNGKWISADLEKYNIIFPMEGIFVGFEFLPPEGLNITDIKNQCVRLATNKSKPLRVQRGFVKKNDKCNTWIKYFTTSKVNKNIHEYIGNKWYYTGSEGYYFTNVGLTNAIISAEIIFYK